MWILHPLICHWLVRQIVPPQTHVIGWVRSRVTQIWKRHRDDQRLTSPLKAELLNIAFLSWNDVISMDFWRKTFIGSSFLLLNIESCRFSTGPSVVSWYLAAINKWWAYLLASTTLQLDYLWFWQMILKWLVCLDSINMRWHTWACCGLLETKCRTKAVILKKAEDFVINFIIIIGAGTFISDSIWENLSGLITLLMKCSRSNTAHDEGRERVNTGSVCLLMKTAVFMILKKSQQAPCPSLGREDWNLVLCSRY